MTELIDKKKLLKSLKACDDEYERLIANIESGRYDAKPEDPMGLMTPQDQKTINEFFHRLCKIDGASIFSKVEFGEVVHVYESMMRDSSKSVEDPRTDAIHKYIKEELEPWMNRARVVMESQEDRIKMLTEEIAGLKRDPGPTTRTLPTCPGSTKTNTYNMTTVDGQLAYLMDISDILLSFQNTHLLDCERRSHEGQIDTLNKKITDMEKKIAELEARINKREPRAKPPLCSVPFDRCPYYLKEDDPIQYPCIMCRYFGRLKTTNQ